MVGSRCQDARSASSSPVWVALTPGRVGDQPVDQRVDSRLTRLERRLGILGPRDEQGRLVDRGEQHVGEEIHVARGQPALLGDPPHARPQSAEDVLLVDLAPPGPAHHGRRVEQRDPLHTGVEGHPQPGREARAEACDRVGRGLESVMRRGLVDQSRLTDEVLQAVREPFRTEESRRALAAAGIQLELEGFAETGRRLHELRMPVRIIYGARDQLLPDVADTMARVERDLPQAVTTTLPNCGHFLQEEAPQQVGELLARFFAEA
jgi:hypothetical protein